MAGSHLRYVLSPTERRFVEQLSQISDKDLAAEGFADVKDTAKYLGLSQAMVYKMLQLGPLPYDRFGPGNSKRIPWVALHLLGELSIVRRDREMLAS
jgi:hypothetical protein